MAKKQAYSLVGRTIVKVRAMNRREMKAEGWEEDRHGAPTVLVLDDGTKLYASRDPEGNGPGAIFGVDPEGTSFGL